MCQFLCNFAAAGEEGVPRSGLQEDLIDHLPVAVNEVQILLWHAGMVQQAHELLGDNGDPASETYLDQKMLTTQWTAWLLQARNLMVPLPDFGNDTSRSEHIHTIAGKDLVKGSLQMDIALLPQEEVYRYSRLASLCIWAHLWSTCTRGLLPIKRAPMSWSAGISRGKLKGVMIATGP